MQADIFWSSIVKDKMFYLFPFQAFYKLFDGGSEIIDFCAFLASKGFLIYNDQASVMENYRRRRVRKQFMHPLKWL